jgi:hypothetical protein
VTTRTTMVHNVIGPSRQSILSWNDVVLGGTVIGMGDRYDGMGMNVRRVILAVKKLTRYLRISSRWEARCSFSMRDGWSMRQSRYCRIVECRGGRGLAFTRWASGIVKDY